ncbi:hypothetical protein lerEdw1_010952 [Lerista edwardsae]|nr:hypothetical protein lerEdw1_010952 [Lerista edwardsae]
MNPHRERTRPMEMETTLLLHNDQEDMAQFLLSGEGSLRCITSRMIWHNTTKVVNDRDPRVCMTKFRVLRIDNDENGNITGGRYGPWISRDLEYCNTFVNNRSVVNCCRTDLCNDKPLWEFIAGWDNRVLPLAKRLL